MVREQAGRIRRRDKADQFRLAETDANQRANLIR
jgi:hypothetical protein